MHIQEVLPKDAIPSIDDPQFGPTYFGDADDRMIVVEGSPARAYPVRILSYHEIVNDTLKGVTEPSPDEGDQSTDRPIAVTWCPICASAVVYERTIDDHVLSFGTSGKLADDALVMYDRQTGTEWKQPLGCAISGPLEGLTLDVSVSSMMSWREFQTTYPNGVVLQPINGVPTDSQNASPRTAYEMDPYERYDAADGFGLREMRGEGPDRSWDRSDIGPKTSVLGVLLGGEAVGYPRPEVEDRDGVIDDTVGGRHLLVVATETGMHAFEHPGFELERRGGRLHGDGTVWDPRTGRGDDGRSLKRLPARHLYAFAWQDDHGPDSFFGLH